MRTLIFIMLFAVSLSAQTHDTIHIAPGGGDYTTLAAGLSGEAQDLTSTDKVIHFEISGDWSGGYEEGQVLVSGYTTDATRYIDIYTVGTARHSGWPRQAESYYKIINTATDANGNIRVLENYTRIDGVIFQQGYGGTSAGDILFRMSGADEARLTNCIFIDTAQAGGTTTGLSVEGSCPGLVIVNCMFHEFNNAGLTDSGQAIFFSTGHANGGLIANNTFNDNGTHIKWSSDSPDSQTVFILNNLFKSADSVVLEMVGSGADTSSFKGDWIYVRNNSKNDAAIEMFIGPTTTDSTISNNILNAEWALVNPKQDDFHLVEEGNTESAIDQGLDLSKPWGSLSFTFTNDVDDMLRRGTWDIGFDEVLLTRRFKYHKK